MNHERQATNACLCENISLVWAELLKSHSVHVISLKEKAVMRYYNGENVNGLLIWCLEVTNIRTYDIKHKLKREDQANIVIVRYLVTHYTL